MSKHPDDDRTRLVSIREALAAANGDWQNIVALWSINADLTWLLERAEAAPATGLPAERPDITATPEEQGLTPGGAVEFMAADRALAVPHRDDDQPCGCDECMAYGAEDEGFDWYRVSPARRIVLRVLDSGDDRLAPVAVAFREHEDAVAETADQRETTPAGVLDEAALAEALFRSQADRRGPDGMGLGSHEADAAAIAREYAAALGRSGSGGGRG